MEVYYLILVMMLSGQSNGPPPSLSMQQFGPFAENAECVRSAEHLLDRIVKQLDKPHGDYIVSYVCAKGVK